MASVARGLPLRSRTGAIRAFAMVDAADFEWLSRWRWSLHSERYAVRHESRGGRKVTILLHRFVVGLEVGDPREVDHENRDRLDCRRSNLRIVPSAANRQNVGGWGVSRFRGVSWYRRSRRWQASFQVNGRKMALGYFDDELAAAVAVERRRLEAMPFAVPDPELAPHLAKVA